MNEPARNGSPEDLPLGELSNDNVVHFAASDDDPDAIVETWPNCRPSDGAFPPRKDEVREAPAEELLALINAMNGYKRERGLQYLIWEDVLDVLHDMGYRKVAPSTESAATSDSATP